MASATKGKSKGKTSRRAVAVRATSDEPRVVTLGASGRSRPSWQGTLTLGMLVLPIGLWKASTSPTKISFNNVHGPKCGGKIHGKPEKTVLKKFEGFVDHAGWCEDCGERVTKDQVTKGFEGRIVPEDILDDLPIGTKKVITVDGLVDAADIDPALWDEPYWVDAGTGGEQAYALLVKSMTAAKKVAVGKVTFRQREVPLVIRPNQGVLMLHAMRYPADMVAVPRSIVERVAETKVTDEMIKLGRQVVDTYTIDWDPSEYEDGYGKVLIEAIAKIRAGKVKDVKRAKSEDDDVPSNVTDLMSVLRASVEEKRKRKAS